MKASIKLLNPLSSFAGSEKINGDSLNYKFCPLCAHPLVEKNIDGRIRKVCEQCGFIHYKNPAPAAGVILEKDGKITIGFGLLKP